MKTFLQTLPIDSVPCFVPTWEDIKDKAHLYATARIRATGQYVKIRTVNSGHWSVSTAPPERYLLATTEELCDFCL